jgi:hypothetical protein
LALNGKTKKLKGFHFGKKVRALTASDIIQGVGDVFAKM